MLPINVVFSCNFNFLSFGLDEWVETRTASAVGDEQFFRFISPDSLTLQTPCFGSTTSRTHSQGK